MWPEAESPDQLVQTKNGTTVNLPKKAGIFLAVDPPVPPPPSMPSELPLQVTSGTLPIGV